MVVACVVPVMCGLLVVPCVSHAVCVDGVSPCVLCVVCICDAPWVLTAGVPGVEGWLGGGWCVASALRSVTGLERLVGGCEGNWQGSGEGDRARGAAETSRRLHAGQGQDFPMAVE